MVAWVAAVKRYADCTCMLCRDPLFHAMVEDVVRELDRSLNAAARRLGAQAQQAVTFAMSPERQALERSWSAPAAEVYE